MSTLVAVDPDTLNPGIAVFNSSSRLISALALDTDDAVIHVAGWLSPILNSSSPRSLFVEMPQQYGRKGDQRDFLRLATVVGRFQQVAITAGAGVELVPPRKWKGSTPKGMCSLRIWDALDLTERSEVQISSKARRQLESGRGLVSGEGSDVLDAIGIGLWRLARLHSRRR